MKVGTQDKRRILINPLKRSDVFRCTHTAHRNFDFSVSAHHVLKEKECYPDGCIGFKWHCSGMKGNKKCHRGFTTVGKDCTYCKYFSEEKDHRVPKLLITEEEFVQLEECINEFEAYFKDLRGKIIEFSGVVASVKPQVVETDSIEGRKLGGYLVQFNHGYIGIDLIKDKIYAQISIGYQQRHRLKAGDSLEFNCYVFLEKGRLVLKKLRKIQVVEDGEGFVWDKGQAMVALSIGRFLETKPKKCRRCPMGLLVDSDGEKCGGQRRRIFCLQGIENVGECVFDVYQGYFEPEKREQMVNTNQ